MKKIDDDEYRLSTGRVLYANRGIIGVNCDLDVFDGYDGHLDGAFMGSYGEPLTEAEQAELCDFMIDVWQKRKALVVVREPEQDVER